MGSLRASIVGRTGARLSLPRELLKIRQAPAIDTAVRNKRQAEIGSGRDYPHVRQLRHRGRSRAKRRWLLALRWRATIAKLTKVVVAPGEHPTGLGQR